MRLLLVLATTTLAANVRWPPQLNEQDAGVVVRGRAVSVVSQRGCFSVDGRPCAAAVPPAGDDDDGALSPPAAVAAAPSQTVDADLLVVTMEANCAGQVGLWHFLVKCVSTLVEDFRSAAGSLPGHDRPTVLLFLDANNRREGASFCTFNKFVERYRWLIESLFDGGVYPSLACYARGHDALWYHRVVAKTKGLGAGWGFQGIFPLLRERGFRALSIDEPPPRTQLTAALHLTRDDGGDDAHRALADDSTLERAFLDAGYAMFDRCCDWNAPAASRAAVVAVARADVIVGMHGAAMTHLLFAKQRAVAVELFSGTLINLRKGGSLWFFARYTKGYYGRIFLRRRPRHERSTLDAAQAARTVRCAGESSAGPRAQRPSCDGVK